MKQNLPSSENASPIKTIAIVEDDDDITTSLLQVYGKETPYHVLIVSRSHYAFETFQRIKPSLLLVDLSLHTTTGIDLYDQLHTIDELANTPTIIVTDTLTPYQQEIEKRRLISMSKPLDVDKLLETIESLLT